MGYYITQRIPLNCYKFFYLLIKFATNFKVFSCLIISLIIIEILFLRIFNSPVPLSFHCESFHRYILAVVLYNKNSDSSSLMTLISGSKFLIMIFKYLSSPVEFYFLFWIVIFLAFVIRVIRHYY